jgi:hypothetical protein
LQAGQWGRFIVGATIGMELHELGHASVAWEASHLALPLPWFTMASEGSASPLVYVVVLALLAMTARAAWREGCRGLLVFCATAMVLQPILTLALRRAAFHTLFAFGGQAGELGLGALLVIAFYHRLPEATRWPMTRYLFLFVGACVFTASFGRWLRARHDPAAIPWGSIFGGDGDMEALRDDAGWSPVRIVRTYLGLGVICLGVIVGYYCWFLRRGAPPRDAGTVP